MTVQLDRLPDITRLDKGGHTDLDKGACLLEAVSYVAGEEFSDHPQCASPILGAFGRSLNDVLPDDKRQLLVPLVPKIVGTADDGHDQERGLMAADWLTRTYVPAWLRLAGLTAEAHALEALPEVTSWDELVAATPYLVAGRKSADAAWAAAWAAAGAAAWAAAWAAARAAARAAAGDAARAAAWAAAGDAAWAAAGAAAGAAAWAAAWAAARAAARDALQPTVDQLQDSAIDLYTRMITIGDTHA